MRVYRIIYYPVRCGTYGMSQFMGVVHNELPLSNILDLPIFWMDQLNLNTLTNLLHAQDLRVICPNIDMIHMTMYDYHKCGMGQL